MIAFGSAILTLFVVVGFGIWLTGRAGGDNSIDTVPPASPLPRDDDFVEGAIVLSTVDFGGDGGE